MQRVLINNLDGPALEWTVARLRGFSEMVYHPTARAITTKQPDGLVQVHDYTTNWGLAGPLLHEHRINISYCEDFRTRGPERLYVYCDAYGDRGRAGYWFGSHDRPLVAGLRCFVKLKNHRDDFVDVPNNIPLEEP